MAVVLPHMTFYRRNLPHWQPEGKVLFLTWSLHGSVPLHVIREVSKQAKDILGKSFVEIDRRLDQGKTGPTWLKDPDIAASVVKSLERGTRELKCFDLFAYVVMSNHVHVLIQPRVPLRRITNGIKGFSARKANKILGRTGQPFWREESFDHWVRNEEEFHRIKSYIEHNPVTAGLVERPEDWPWSSATKERWTEGLAQPGMAVPLSCRRWRGGGGRGWG